MALKTRSWISLWFIITFPVIIWDAGYCFMRPRSMKGGDLHWIWSPYAIYQNVDLVYGVKALEDNDGFTNAQSLLNVVENTLNFLYLYAAYVKGWPAANLIAFTSVTMTLAKTYLYLANEYFCGWCATGHNPWSDLFLYWIFPNGLWILVPSLIWWTLGKEIVGQITTADAVQTKAKTK